jgi:hypothetical protein
MDISRLTKFDWVAAGAGLVAIISLWFSWYGADFMGASVSIDAWQASKYADVFILLMGLAAIALVAVRLLPQQQVPNLVSAIGLMAVGVLVVLVVLYRMVHQTGTAEGDKMVGLQFGIVLTFVCGALIAAAGFLKLSETSLPSPAGSAAGPGYPGQMNAQQYAPAQGYAPQTPPQAPQYAAPQAPPQYAAPQAPPQYAAPQAPAPYSAPQAPPQYGAPQAPVAPAAAAPEVQSAGFGFCTSCGTAYPAADAQFCTSCGAERGQ